MKKLFSFFHKELFSKDKEAKFQSYIDSRARPVVAYVYAIGGIIPVIFLLLAYTVSLEHFCSVAPARLTYIAIWAVITWATFKPSAYLSIRSSLIIYTFVGVVFITYMNAFITQNQLFIVPSVLMFLIGIVIAQVGSRVQFIAGLISIVVPLALLSNKQQMTNDDFSVVVLLVLWAVISWLASIILEQVNRRLFKYEQALAEAGEQKQKLLEKEARSNQFKSQFLAQMSHEIRTPLTSVIGYAESYVDADYNALKQNKVLETIYTNSQHLLHIANDILDLSKIEAGKLEIELMATELFKLCQELEQNQKPLAEKKSLKFGFYYHFPLPSCIVTDCTRLYQILLNLTNNAIKFTEQGEVLVTVSYQADKHFLIFKVKDTGIGMSNQVIKSLFTAFSQADNSYSRRFGGTGLGLYISKVLAENLGGGIEVNSQVNIGSEFIVSIKASVLERCEWVNSIPEENYISRNAEIQITKMNGRVLLAEDHSDNRRLICQKLNKLGITVCQVSDGEQAVKKALLLDFDLILMDIQMPVMDGVEAVKMIRKHDPKTPIVALTANAMKQDIIDYLDNGFNAHLSKPIAQFEFVLLLSQFLDPVEEENDDELLLPVDSQEFLLMIEEYKAGLPKQLTLLKQAYQINNWEQVSQLSHSLKGSAGNFGFNRLTDIAAELESCLKQCRHEQRDTLYHMLIAELDKIISKP